MLNSAQSQRVNSLQEIQLTQPDDWHLHLRDGPILNDIVDFTARQFARAIVMPNLSPPVTTLAMAAAYRNRILQAKDPALAFKPLLTLYLTANTTPHTIREAAQHPDLYACKLYPAGATTNSDHGVTHIEKIYPVLEAMQQNKLPLLIHGEVTSPEVDVFDREARFIEKILAPLCELFPELKIVFEHLTTKQGVDFVSAAKTNVAATITPQHLLLNRNALFTGGIRPHHYCLPVLKREQHRLALVKAATSGNAKFFLGTDSAPHARSKKENPCGCAGIFSAHAAIELYAEVFDQANALDKLEGFAAFFGADFYGLTRNTQKITLRKETWKVPESYPFENESVIPFRAGEQIHWKLLAE